MNGTTEAMSSRELSFPRLVADIGGTNVRFGMVRGPGMSVTDIFALRCRDYDGPAAAAQAYLERVVAQGLPAQPPVMASFAVATAVTGDLLQLTNSAWLFSQSDTRQAMKLQKLVVINDFEAMALALPSLRPDDYQLIGSALPQAGLPMAALGPGTGLGVATVVPAGNSWVALPGEGGHATLSASNDFESELLKAARVDFPHVSAERMLSGIGLPVLYRAVCTVRKEVASTFTAEEISTRGLGQDDPACTDTLSAFCAFLGGFAGNLALTVGARGGVFISGGIVPRLGDFFARSRFRERFEAKGRFSSYTSAIATALVVAPYAPLAGAAQALGDMPLGTEVTRVDP